jgi:polyphosphate kinase 2
MAKHKKAKKEAREQDTHTDSDSTQPGEKTRLRNKDYKKELYKLHAELVKLQDWVKHEGLRAVVVFEGRDAAGKGGTIKAITERVSPRVFRVVALPTPTDREKTQLYMQRYITHFPAAGEIVLFDRSWYNRAGVERVMGFCTEEEYRGFLHYVPLFEKSITDAGIILIKYWLDVDMAEQERRFRNRINDPRKTWKLSPMDVESYNRWYDYSRARDDMFAASDTQYARWHILRTDDKKRARLNCISHLLSMIPYREIPREKVKLGKRSSKGAFDDEASLAGRYFVPEKY